MYPPPHIVCMYLPPHMTPRGQGTVRMYPPPHMIYMHPANCMTPRGQGTVRMYPPPRVICSSDARGRDLGCVKTKTRKTKIVCFSINCFLVQLNILLSAAVTQVIDVMRQDARAREEVFVFK